jgi:hypothetical protein
MACLYTVNYIYVLECFFCNINHCNDSAPCWDLDWTIKYYLILTVSWYCIVQYPVKTGKFTYNCITTMNFLTNFTITKFCLRLIIQKSSFCSQNSNIYICQRQSKSKLINAPIMASLVKPRVTRSY